MGIVYNTSIVRNGLVLHLDAANTKSYPGSGSTWSDLSGNGNHGTLINGPTYSSADNGSFSFDGTNDYVNIGDNKFKYQDNFSIEAIAKFPTLPNNPGFQCGARHPIIYNHDYGYNLLIISTGKVRWQIYNTSSEAKNIDSINSVTGPNFFHAVGIKSGTTIALYLNGVLQGTNTLTSNEVHYRDFPFVIGGYATCGSDKFYATGNISLVKVYNRVLSASEISQNFNALRGRYGI